MSNENKEPLSNVSESVEEAAKRFYPENKFPISAVVDDKLLRRGFKRGANWQKEQDNAIIKELLDTLSELSWHGGTEEDTSIQIAITKAEQHLNKS